MADQVVWWGFLCATACSIVHVCALAAYGLRKGRPGSPLARAQARLRVELVGGFAAQDKRPALGLDNPAPFPEEVLARYFIGKGLLTESEFVELLGEEEEQYHALVINETQH